MNVLIVFAHPESKSLNGSLKDLAVSVLSQQGHGSSFCSLSNELESDRGREDFQHLQELNFSYVRESKQALRIIPSRRILRQNKQNYYGQMLSFSVSNGGSPCLPFKVGLSECMPMG